MTTIIRPIRQILRETILENGKIGKIDADLFKSQLPFDPGFLKDKALTNIVQKRFGSGNSFQIVKKVLKLFEDHYSLVVDGGDSFSYVAFFTSQIDKNMETGMGNFKYITHQIGTGHFNIALKQSAQFLVKNPIYQVNLEFVQLNPFKVEDNLRGETYWGEHKEELSGVMKSSLDDPVTVLKMNKVIIEASEIIIKITSS